MVELLILLLLLLFLLDCGNLVFLRSLVYSFLLSKRNIKGAKKIHNEQSLKNRLFLSYIVEYAIYKKEFVFYHKCWVFNLISLVPQYSLLFVVLMISSFVSLLFTVVLVLLKLILFFFVMSNFSNRISKFDKRYSERKRQ